MSVYLIVSKKKSMNYGKLSRKLFVVIVGVDKNPYYYVFGVDLMPIREGSEKRKPF